MSGIGCNAQFTIENLSKKPVDVTGSMYVTASDGSTYQSDASADSAGISTDHLDGTLNPNESAIINVAFNLPEGLRLTGFFVGDSATAEPLARTPLGETVTYSG